MTAMPEVLYFPNTHAQKTWVLGFPLDINPNPQYNTLASKWFAREQQGE